MVKDILDLIGLVEGINYSQQAQVSDGRDRPDFTFFLPDEKAINMDVKFPLAHYEKYIAAESDLEKESEKKEPMLNISDNESDGIDMLEDEFNQDLESDSDEIGTKSDEIEEDGDNKDDELLDIPTFLRRQAN